VAKPVGLPSFYGIQDVPFLFDFSVIIY